MKTTVKKTPVAYLLNKHVTSKESFVPEFKEIILSHVSNYGDTREDLRAFFEELQHGGCISGMISEFIYHHDCKEFYVKHIDDLEEYKEELEEEMGEPIKNRHNTKHYTFVVWLCFEEFCYRLFNEIFEG